MLRVIYNYQQFLEWYKKGNHHLREPDSTSQRNENKYVFSVSWRVKRELTNLLGQLMIISLTWEKLKVFHLIIG